MPVKAECYECGKEITVAMWDDPVISGVLKVVCRDCESPEDNLWDLERIREVEEEEDLGFEYGYDVPEGDEDVSSGDGYRIRVRERDKTLDDGVVVNHDLYVEDVDDEELVERAREEVRSLKED